MHHRLTLVCSLISGSKIDEQKQWSFIQKTVIYPFVVSSLYFSLILFLKEYLTPKKSRSE